MGIGLAGFVLVIIGTNMQEREHTVESKTLIVTDRRGNFAATAIVDAEDYDRLKQYRWLRDNQVSPPFRMILFDGQKNKIHLQREVMGCKIKDGKVVRFKTKDRLDCRKSNLFFGKDYDLEEKTKKHFPRLFENFVSYVDLHYSGTPIANFLHFVDARDFSRKKVTLLVPDEHGASRKEREDELKSILERDFRFTGLASIVIARKAEPVDVPPPAAPAAQDVPPEGVTVSTSGAAAAPPASQSELDLALAHSIVTRCLRPGSEFQYVKFEIKEGTDTHVFEYKKDKINGE